MARSPSSPAQVGAGDERIVAGPGYRDIPKCKLPLKTEAGQREYDTYARVIFDAGLFDMYRHTHLSMYAQGMDEIFSAADKGLSVKTELRKATQRSFEALGVGELDKPIAAPKGAQTNKYAGCGFAARSVQALRDRQGRRARVS